MFHTFHSPIPWKRLILFLAIILAALLVLIFAILLPFYFSAAKISLTVGEQMGTLAGRATGSYYGFKEGIGKGAEAGRADGLSAEDIVTEVQDTLTRAGKLQVLVAKVTLEDLLTIGEDETYRALQLLRGDAIFTVDLQQAVITTTSDTVMVHLPDPEPKITIDEEECETVRKYHRDHFGGEDVDGFTAALNSRQKTMDEALDNIKKDQELMEQARSAAKKQTTLLAQNICGASRQVTVTVG